MCVSLHPHPKSHCSLVRSHIPATFPLFFFMWRARMQADRRSKPCYLLPLWNDTTKSLVWVIQLCLNHSEIFLNIYCPFPTMHFCLHGLKLQANHFENMWNLWSRASSQILTMNWHPSDIGISEERSVYYRNIIFLPIESAIQVSKTSSEAMSSGKGLLGWPSVLWNKFMGVIKP